MARRVDYYFKETFQGLRRNGLVAFAAVSTSFIALFLVGMALLVRDNVNLIIKFAEADVQVSVYLNDAISTGEQQHINDVLLRMPQVSGVQYESKEQAYRRAKDIFKGNESIVQFADPSAFPASFRVKLKDPSQFGVVSAQLTGQPGIDNIVDHSGFVKRLLAVTAVFRVGVFAVAIVMLVAAAFLIMNTVRMAVFARRKEIGIMRLVGATNWHIRIPFIIEGVIEGLLGAGAAIVGLFIIKVAFFDSLRKSVAFLPWIGTPAVVHAIPWLLTGGVVIAVFGSLVAMRRFLEV
jgi:cell division transport system permease protein